MTKLPVEIPAVFFFKNLIKHIYYSAVSKDGEKFMEIDDTFMYLFTS